MRPLSSHHDLLGYALHTSLDIVLERALARVDDGDTPSLVDALRDVARYVFVALTHEPEPTVRAEAARLGAAYRALRFETVDHFKDAYCAWLLRIHFLRNVSFELWIKRYYAIQIWLPYQRDCARDAATHRGVADATVTAAAAALYATPYMHRVSFSTTLDDDESSLFFVLYTRERVFERHDDWRIEKDARFSNCFYCTIYAENE